MKLRSESLLIQSTGRKISVWISECQLVHHTLPFSNIFPGVLKWGTKHSWSYSVQNHDEPLNDGWTSAAPAKQVPVLPPWHTLAHDKNTGGAGRCLAYMHGLLLTHTQFHCKQRLLRESHFQGGSKKLCSVHAALEQITLFDFQDFGLYIRRWPGKEMFYRSRGSRGYFHNDVTILSLCF